MPAAPSPSLARRHLALPGAPALGWVEAEASVGGLTRVRFLEDAPVGRSAGSQAQPEAGNEQGEVRAAAAHLAHFAEELAAYLRGARGPFTVPVQASGTAFQREVWGALRLLNHGALTTYGELAAGLGKPTAVRAVGAAVGRNPLLIVVPCHRVIGSSGQLTGYAAGVDRKRALLDLEAAAAAVPPLIAEPDGSELLTLSPAEAAAVIGALVQGGVRFDEAGPEAAGCAGPEVAVLRFPAGSDHIKIGAALVAARETGP